MTNWSNGAGSIGLHGVSSSKDTYNLCDAASRAMDRALHNVDCYCGLTDMVGLTIQHVVQNKQRFVTKLLILKRNDFWNESKWLGGAYNTSTNHLDQQQTPVLIGDSKIKWLDFGTTPDPGTYSPILALSG